ncbi:MAG: zinc transporter ZupT [Bacillota bacterium]
MKEIFVYPLLLSFFAGLSTIFGSLIGLFYRKPSPRFMGLTLGLSAGVMLIISFAELLPHSIETGGFGPAYLAFFCGLLLMLTVDFLVPHDFLGEHHKTGEKKQARLLKTGLFVALGMAIHNFPEGIASFAGGLQDLRLGAAIAMAVMIHNIPEGLAVSAPIFAATGSRKKAFLWSFLSGMVEPVGALLSAFILAPFFGPVLLGRLLAAVAGVMVFISLDELIPASYAYGEEHTTVIGAIIGMAIMVFSLGMLKG